MIHVTVAPHPSYSRSGLNLNVTLPISIGEAIRGSKIDLPTPHGTITVTVPPNSSGGKSLRLKGMGIKTKDKSGDLIAQLQIVVPPDLSDEENEIVNKLDAAWNGSSPREGLAW